MGWHDAFHAGVLKLSHLTSELFLDPNLYSSLSPFPLFFVSPLCSSFSPMFFFSVLFFPWGRGIWWGSVFNRAPPVSDRGLC